MNPTSKTERDITPTITPNGTFPTFGFTPPPSITPEQLAPATPLRLQNQAPSTTATGILSDVTALTTGDATRAKERDAADREMRIAELRSTGSGASKNLADIMNQLATVPDERARLEDSADIQGKQEQLDEIDSRLSSIDQATRTRLQRLKENSAGMTQGAYEDEVRRIEREGAQESADVAIVRSALQNKLTTAQSFVDKKIELATESLKARFDAIKFFYDENKEELSKEEQREFEQLTKDADREYTETRDKVKATEEAKLSLLKSAAQNGAPASVLQAIQKATSAEDAVIKAGSWINKIEIDKAARDAQAGQEDQLYSGLTPQTATAVRGQASAFKSEPLVQNFATIQEGYNFAKSIPDTTTNPADDQALIYALAKTLDPGSVVREGEYATAQKYAQSWIKAYGKGVSQAIAGTGFLSEEARKNIKETIKTKYNASQKSYETIRKSYVTGINDLTGRKDGEKFVRDYKIEANAIDSQEDPLGILGTATTDGADNNPLGI